MFVYECYFNTKVEVKEISCVNLVYFDFVSIAQRQTSCPHLFPLDKLQ